MVEKMLGLSEDSVELIRELADTKYLLDLTNDAILVRTPDERIVYWNACAESRYGWTREEAVGQVSHDLLQTRFPMPFEAVRLELQRESRWEGELVHATVRGGRVVVRSRWALLKNAEGNSRAILQIDTDITDRILLEKQVEEKSSRLREADAALKVLLRRRDEDERTFEEALLTNMENLILPYVRRLRTSGLNGTQAALIEILESHFKLLTTTFGKVLALQYRTLTPTEMRIAALVREGKGSKEIGELLCLSEKTVSFHRGNIRNKLGLRKGGDNLRSHLLNIS